MALRILVVGGGTGGVVSSRRIAARLRSAGLKLGEDVEVALVTDSDKHFFQPLFFDVAFGNATPDETQAPIRSLEYYGVRVIVNRVERIDLANRRVELESRDSLEYDYLVVSLGVRYGWEAYPGLSKAGYHNYTLEGALRLAEALRRFRGGRIVVLVPETPHRCMMYPHEVATMIAETMRARGLGVEVVVVTAEKAPLIGLSPEYPRVWLSLYNELGVEHVVHRGLEEINVEKRLVRASNIEEKYDLLIKVPPSRLPAPLERSEGLVYKSDPRWSNVSPRFFRHPEYDEVFLPGEHSMPVVGLPSAGIPVHFASEYVSDIIVSNIVGGSPVSGLGRVMTCVGYYGARRGFVGNCEVRYSEERGKWSVSCYTLSTSPFIRLLKEAFYKAWTAQLK